MSRRSHIARAVLLVPGLLLLGSAHSGWAATAESMSKRLHEELEQFVRARADGRVNRVEIPGLDAFDRLGLGSDGVDVGLRTRLSGGLLGRVPVTVILTRDGAEVKRAVVTVGLHALKSVLVANRAINRGEVIGEKDFRSERRDISVLRGPVITRSSELVGMRVRRAIQTGRVWQPRHLETVPVVRRGEQVRLRLVSGGLQIDGAGKAGEDGRAGDWIRVLNDASRRYVTGQVDAEGTVYVRF